MDAVEPLLSEKFPEMSQIGVIAMLRSQLAGSFSVPLRDTLALHRAGCKRETRWYFWEAGKYPSSLRRDPNPKRYRLVGVAYFHGIMHGRSVNTCIQSKSWIN